MSRLRKGNRRVRRDWGQKTEHGHVKVPSARLVKSLAARDRYEGYRRKI